MTPPLCSTARPSATTFRRPGADGRTARLLLFRNKSRSAAGHGAEEARPPVRVPRPPEHRSTLGREGGRSATPPRRGGGHVGVRLRAAADRASPRHTQAPEGPKAMACQLKERPEHLTLKGP